MHGTGKFLPQQDNFMNGAWPVAPPPTAPLDSVCGACRVSLAGLCVQFCCIGESRLKRGQRGARTLDIRVISTTL